MTFHNPKVAIYYFIFSIMDFSQNGRFAYFLESTHAKLLIWHYHCLLFTFWAGFLPRAISIIFAIMRTMSGNLSIDTVEIISFPCPFGMDAIGVMLYSWFSQLKACGSLPSQPSTLTLFSWQKPELRNGRVSSIGMSGTSIFSPSGSKVMVILLVRF